MRPVRNLAPTAALIAFNQSLVYSVRPSRPALKCAVINDKYGQVSGSQVIDRSAGDEFGEVSERLKEHAWKVCKSKGFEGSNPSLTAK